MTAVYKYSIFEFEAIKDSGFNYVLSEKIVNCISELSLEVGSPSYVKTPIFKKKEIMPFKRKKKPTEVLTDDDWETIRTFQATELEEKEGFEKQIDQIRSHLNKLSDKNYDIILNELICILDIIVKDINDEHKDKISIMIYDICYSNRFYSELYAKIYKELLDLYSWMNNVFNVKKSEYINLFDNMEFIEATEDYSKFCNSNNENEKRKACSTFIINLFKLEVVDKVYIKDNLLNLINRLKKYIGEKNKKSHVDVIMENICILKKIQIM